MENPLIAKWHRHCHLDEADIDAIEDLCVEVRDVARGLSVVREGDRAERVHLILAGWAARYKLLPNGSRQITALLLPGDLCDLRCSMLERVEDGIIALTPLRVAYIAPQAITRLEQRRPRIARALGWNLLVDQAILRAWVVNIGRRHALERVAHLFCELAARQSMAADTPTGPMYFPLTQEEIADVLGLTAVHVNRVLNDLRRRALISSRRGGLTVLDFAGLKQMAGFNDKYLHPQMASSAETVD